MLIGETGLHFDVGLAGSQQAGNVPKTDSSSPSFFSWVSKASSVSESQVPKAYTSKQFQQAFDNILNGLDRTMAHYTLWNYTIENDRQFGDGWNGENLSLYCKEGGLVTSQGAKWNNFPVGLDSGGRAIEQFCRPYPIATVGRPLKFEFDRHQVLFKLWTASAANQAHSGAEEETEIYVPGYHFGGPDHCDVKVSDGSIRWSVGHTQEDKLGSMSKELLYWKYGNEKEHWIEIRRTK